MSHICRDLPNSLLRAAAVAETQQDPFYLEIMQFLREALHDQDVQNRVLDGTRLTRSQGVALALEELAERLNATSARNSLKRRTQGR